MLTWVLALALLAQAAYRYYQSNREILPEKNCTSEDDGIVALEEKTENVNYFAAEREEGPAKANVPIDWQLIKMPRGVDLPLRIVRTENVEEISWDVNETTNRDRGDGLQENVNQRTLQHTAAGVPKHARLFYSLQDQSSPTQDRDDQSSLEAHLQCHGPFFGEDCLSSMCSKAFGKDLLSSCVYSRTPTTSQSEHRGSRTHPMQSVSGWHRAMFITLLLTFCITSTWIISDALGRHMNAIAVWDPGFLSLHPQGLGHTRHWHSLHPTVIGFFIGSAYFMACMALSWLFRMTLGDSAEEEISPGAIS